ncbi:MAG: histidine phosphatase family protein [Aquamicrobium sp.]|uniref:SixA phosphatase family protein n=1 Tax=Aquamicrobium sp. TaxID=1872579 RepID=UPI00349EF91B|nr:histidine phosphatase family protein [Aquamicrobium sp.]MCO5157076.1 histidine phosphatase family protein [Aquamicrobium sp.]
MTRTLLLLRHAKSSWDDPALDDFDRPLAKRGREAAPRMAREMARRSWLPDRALVSAALRTRQTWVLVEAELPRTVPAVLDRSIYEAPAGRILDAVRSTPAGAETLLVVGHNPGFEDLIALLAAPDSTPDAMEKVRRKFPTAGLARLAFAGAWADLGPGGARLTEFLTPRDGESR